MTDTRTSPTSPSPMTWNEQQELYRQLVAKKDRSEDEQDFLEAVGMAFVLDDLFSEEPSPSSPPPTTPLTNDSIPHHG